MLICELEKVNKKLQSKSLSASLNKICGVTCSENEHSGDGIFGRR